jgi:Ca2+-binding RTX toxin-like protein
VIGDSVTVLTSTGARSGTFASATGGDLPGDISWAADYAPGSFSLRAARPALGVADAYVTEADTGTRQLTFTLTQSESLLAATSVSTATLDGSATAAGPTYGGNDYDATSLTATIPPGSTTATVDVPIRSDVVYEHNDAFTLGLSAPVNLTLSDGTATGTIVNDEAVPTLTLGDLAVIERDPGQASAAAVRSTLSGPSAFTTTATWSTSDGTATGNDYSARSAAISFAPGVVQRNLSVPVTGDLTTEDDETFGVALSNGAPAGDVTTGGAGTVTIRDDDAAVSIAPATGQEPPVGTAPLTATITLSHPNPRAVTLRWATADGSATAPGDYVSVAPTAVTIPVGTTSKTVTVTINSDDVVESEETFAVPLTSIVGGQPGTTSATMTILPNRCTVWGTNGNDPNLTGTPGHDVICGLGGNDIITIKPGAAGGNDEIYGGSPSGAGSDGVDTLSYIDMTCGVEVDLLNEYAEDPLTDPPTPACIGPGRDLVRGIENVTGGTAGDTLRGDTKNNFLQGLGGNDTLLGDAGDDRVYGGLGTDAASYVRGYTSGVSVDLSLSGGQVTGAGTDQLSSIEGLFGTPLADALFGNAGANTLSGLEGDDEIRGGAGNDLLFGLAGADSLFGDAGTDRAFGDVGPDKLFGGDGTDTLHGDDGIDQVDGGAGDNDRVWGDADLETVLDLLGGAGVGDRCYQASTVAGGFVAGAGCEN